MADVARHDTPLAGEAWTGDSVHVHDDSVHDSIVREQRCLQRHRWPVLPEKILSILDEEQMIVLLAQYAEALRRAEQTGLHADLGYLVP